MRIGDGVLLLVCGNGVVDELVVGICRRGFLGGLFLDDGWVGGSTIMGVSVREERGSSAGNKNTVCG